MDDRRECVDWVAREQDVDLDQLGSFHTVGLVVEARIALRAALHLIEEVQNHFGQRDPVGELDTLGREVLQLLHDTTTGLGKIHHGAGVVRRGHDAHLQHRLFDELDLGAVGQLRRIIDQQLGAVGLVHVVLHRRRSRDEAQAELALEAFAHDLHVQQAEEPTSETKAKRTRCFGLEGVGRIVETKLLQRITEGWVFVAVDRIEARKDHRKWFLITGERLGGRVARGGDGFTRTRLSDIFDACDQVAHLAGPKFLHRFVVGRADTNLFDVVGCVSLHEQRLRAAPKRSIDDPDRGDHATVGVEMTVEDECLGVTARVTMWRRCALYDGIEQLFNALPRLCANAQYLFGWDAEHVLDLFCVLVRLSSRKVDLVERRHDL